MFQAVAGPASSRLINQSGRPRSIYRSPQIDGPLRTDSSNRSAAIRSPNSHVTCFYNHLSIGKSLHPPTRPPSHHHRPASATPAPPRQSQTNRARSTFLQSICKNQIKDNKKKKERKKKNSRKSMAIYLIYFSTAIIGFDCFESDVALVTCLDLPCLMNTRC